MRVLLVYHSQTGNTKRIAEAIASGIGKECVVKKVSEVKPGDIKRFDVIGFGTGVYFGKPGRSIVEFIERLPKAKKRVFVFATYGIGFFGKKAIKTLETKLEAKGFTVGKAFGCLGFDNWGLLKIVGGINKGKPNEEDIKRAHEFGKALLP
ncbi:MAG: flavodoxin domain-containing protein [Candidatus Diapherotrites archaeon]|nr:flavodoxin domain-containing protein [Candidatus Diapherotrites archaeon]